MAHKVFEENSGLYVTSFASKLWKAILKYCATISKHKKSVLRDSLRD